MNKKYPTFFLTWFDKFAQVPYPGFLDPCVHMEMYFEAMRFVSILLDFSKKKCIQGYFNKGHART